MNVSIFISDFGKERINDEQLNGPKNIWKE